MSSTLYATYVPFNALADEVSIDPSTQLSPPLAALTLPAGKYMLTGKAQLKNESGEPLQISVLLKSTPQTSPFGDEVNEFVLAKPDATFGAADDVIVLHCALEFAQEATVDMVISATPGGRIRARAIWLSALKVDTLNQTLWAGDILAEVS